MKRFAITAACVGLFAFGLLSTSEAAPNVVRVRVLNGQRFLAADLAVTQFSGVVQGGSFLLSGSVSNNGPADYFGALALNRGIQGRRLQVFVVLNGGLGRGGRTVLLRSFLVPSLRAGDTWTPAINIPIRQVPGSATAQFLLVLTPGDINSANDGMQTLVTPVR